MLIHKEKENFKQLIEITADNMKLEKRIIEKDYWITYALKKLSENPVSEQIIFRGGTSLTKCYTDLKRFSEDIDLAVNINNDLTKSKITTIMKKAESVMCVDFEKTESDDNIKHGNYRNVEYKYTELFNIGSDPMQELNPRLKIETVTFLHPNPYEKKEVKSFIYNYLENEGLSDIIEKYQLQPFTLNVLSIKRTVIDKIISLVRMSYEDSLKELCGKTRHLYDLHMTYDLVKDFYSDKKQFKDIVKIVRDDEENSRFKDQYPYKKKWSDSPLFNVIDYSRIKDAYENKFGAEFVYGELPSYNKILYTMQLIKEHLISIDE